MVAVGVSVGPTVRPRESPSMSFQLSDFKKVLVSHVGSTLTKQRAGVKMKASNLRKSMRNLEQILYENVKQNWFVVNLFCHYELAVHDSRDFLAPSKSHISQFEKQIFYHEKQSVVVLINNQQLPCEASISLLHLNLWTCSQNKHIQMNTNIINLNQNQTDLWNTFKYNFAHRVLEEQTFFTNQGRSEDYLHLFDNTLSGIPLIFMFPPIILLHKILMSTIILHIFTLLISSAICQTFNWTKPESLNRGLPSSIQIFTLNQSNSPFGTNLTGGYARFNMNDSNLEFIVKDTNGDALGYFPKTPEQYAEVEENVVYSVLNGGFFNMQLNTSASFLAEKKKIKSKNEINSDANHHPTVGAFGFTVTGQFQSEYVYSYGANFTTYKFKTANPYPGPAPTESSGQKWQVIEGIGAGPLLVRNHEVIPGNPENFGESSMINTRHPRSAICVDVQNRLYFVAIDGRYDHSAGLYMGQLAILMKSIGCRHAMNLDGGGSTNLYANKVTINRPSDATGPRPVVSAVLIRDKYKKKNSHLLTE